MKYEILKEGTGLQFCKYNAIAGVARATDEREVFQSILKSNKIDYYVCSHCIYIVVGEQYDILFRDLSMLSKIKNKLFFILEDGERIEVTKQNFSIRCCIEKPNCPDAWVKIYHPKA